MQNNIDTTFVLALIGALAWLPPIISGIYRFFSKPKLRFVPEGTCEIGYTSFGPIFNQFFAISTSHKDALVERIAVTIVHENGSRHDFWWKFLDERGPEITSQNTGEKAEWRKNQPAIALKISTLGLVEKKIGFQDIAFQNRLTTFVGNYQEKESYLARTKPENYLQEATNSKEFLDISDYLKSGFYWTEGKYTAHFFIYETTIKKPHVERFKFELTKANIEVLEKDIKITQDYLKDLILSKEANGKKMPVYNWLWVNPVFQRV